MKTLTQEMQVLTDLVGTGYGCAVTMTNGYEGRRLGAVARGCCIRAAVMVVCGRTE